MFLLEHIFCLQKNKERWYSVLRIADKIDKLHIFFQMMKEHFSSFLLSSHSITLSQGFNFGWWSQGKEFSHVPTLSESCNQHQTKSIIAVHVINFCVLMNTGVSLTANLSCFCLLLTPPIPTLHLIKTNAIYEAELLFLQMII